MTATEKQILLHRLLREVLKHYTVFETQCAQSGNYDIHRGNITINFLDLKGCLKNLSKRQKEAVYWFVIRDEKQKVVAARMGISTVTVGQYVESGLMKVAQVLWPEHFSSGKQTI